MNFLTVELDGDGWFRCAAGSVAGIGAAAGFPCAAGSVAGVGAARLPCAAGSVAGVGTAAWLAAGGRYVFGFRPEKTVIRAVSDGVAGIIGTVQVNEFHGERCVITVQTNCGQIKAVDDGDSPWRDGDAVALFPDIESAHFFDCKNGVALCHTQRSTAT